MISDGSRQRTLGVSHTWVSWSSMAEPSAGRGWSQAKGDSKGREEGRSSS